MIQRLLTLFLVLGCLLSCSSVPDARADLLVAQIQAKHENKFLLLDFCTDWGPPCKSFAKASLEDPAIAGFLSSVILVNIDGEKGTGVDLAAEYEVESFPTFVLMKADGTVLHHWTGYQKQMFLVQMQEFMESEVDPTSFP